ncbi:MAG: ASCH domain-containing protein [Oscillospiraceae bacterium]|nr:ASCH domain-containing protein [Oscillospiraceae bacterium]
MRDMTSGPLAAIRTERVTVLPYRDVGGEHARREGEGDLSLAYWRRVREAFLPRRRHRRV